MRLKLVILILILTGVHVCATSRAQGITLQVKDATLSTVFELIEKQSGYGFFYEDADLKGTKKVSIDLQNASLKTALEKCFQGQPLQYQIIEKNIVVKAKAQPSPSTKPTPQKRIRGKITDSNGQPMAGVNIKVKGTPRTTISDAQGNYTIDGNEGQVLLATFLGYEPQEITVGEQNELNFSLKEGIGQLQQVSVVSTGFQTIPKERSTGSFAQLDNELINRRVGANILDRLEGVTSSLVINKNYSAGNVNSSPFSIRGMSTIFGNAKPLIVVDNFPVDGDITNLNPNDVESITVLKDATAASIWGARAGNGVIVITTKKGGNNKPLNISINSNFTLGSKPDIYYNQAYLDASGFIEAEQFFFGKGYYDASLNNTTTRPVVSPVVEILALQRSGSISSTEATARIDALKGFDVRDDISRYFYRNTLSQQYSLNLNAGGEKYSYSISGGFDNVPSEQEGNEYNRASLNSNFIFNPVKNLEIYTGFQFATTKQQSNALQGAIAPTGKINYYPYANLVDANGAALALPKDYRQTYINSLSGTQLLDWQYRPFDELNNNNVTTKSNYTRLNAGLKYTIAKGLNIDLRYQLEKQDSGTINLQNQNSYFTRNLINLYSSISGTTVTRPIPLGSILDNDKRDLTGNAIRVQVNFDRNFSGKHDISAIAGIDGKEVITNRYLNRFYGFDELTSTSSPVDLKTSFNKYGALSFAGTIPYGTVVDKTTDEYFSYFANASYTYFNRYSLSGSARIDQSNLFGVKTNQKNIPLWSTGLAWNVSNEPFFKPSWLPYLRLRATYGYSGNVDKSVSAFTTGIYSTASITVAPQVTIQNPPNPELRWERIGMFNAGIDFRAFGNHFSGSIEYYRKNGRDLMGLAPLDPTVGVREFKGNVASIIGNGIDIDLTYNSGTKLNWTSNLLYSYANNKVTQYKEITTIGSVLVTADGYNESSIIPVIGRPIFSLFSYPWAGLDPVDGAPMGYLNGNVTKDYAALANSNNLSLLTFNGSSRPTSFGSFRNTLSYRRFSLSANITYKFGYYFRKPALSYNDLGNNYRAFDEFNNRWRSPGDEQNTNVPAFLYPLLTVRDNFYQYAAINIERGDHIRLQDIQLSYDLNKLMTKLPFRNLTVYSYVNNIGLLWKATKTNIDPDFIRDNYIAPRTYAIGLKASF